MINYIANGLGQALPSILVGIWMFIVGCAYQNHIQSEQNKKYDQLVYKNRILKNNNEYYQRKQKELLDKIKI